MINICQFSLSEHPKEKVKTVHLRSHFVLFFLCLNYYSMSRKSFHYFRQSTHRAEFRENRTPCPLDKLHCYKIWSLDSLSLLHKIWIHQYEEGQVSDLLCWSLSQVFLFAKIGHAETCSECISLARIILWGSNCKRGSTKISKYDLQENQLGKLSSKPLNLITRDWFSLPQATHEEIHWSPFPSFNFF